MSATAPPSAESASPARAASRRVAALAVRLFELPAAVVLRRRGEDDWEPLVVYGAQAERLLEELNHYSFFLETSQQYVVVPDLDEDPRMARVVPMAGTQETQRLRFLGAFIHAPDGDDIRVCLCLLDARPRQLRTVDRQLLGELAGLLADVCLSESVAEGVCRPPPSADMVALPPGAGNDGGNAVTLAARLAELTRENEALRARAARGEAGAGEAEHVRFRQLSEESPDCVALANLDGKVYYLNAAGQRLVALDGTEEIRRTRVIDYLMREDRSFFLGTVVPTLMRSGRWQGDFRFRNFKTNSAVPVSWNLFLLRDPQTGRPSGMASVARDITDRQRAEAALRESEKRFRHLVEQAGDSILVYDLDGRLIDVNQEACECLGYGRGELLTLAVADIDPEFDGTRNSERWKSMVPGVAVTMNGHLRRKDGKAFPIEARVAVFRSEGQKLVLALVRDITERKRAEEALRFAHEQLEERVRVRTAELARANDDLRAASRENGRLAAAIESCQVGVLISDPQQPDAPATFANAAFTRITGYGRRDAIGRNCRFLQGAETDPAEIEAIRQAVAARRPYQGTLRNYRKDGTPFWNELTINPVFDETGKLIDFIGFQSDVTAKVEAQAALQRSELRFSRMTANVPGIVYQLLLRPDGTALFPYVSEGCRELFGLEPEQMRPDACTLLDRIHAEDLGGFLHSLEESQRTGEAWRWEGRYTGADGQDRWLQGAARPDGHGPAGMLWDGLLLDITTRKRAEAALRTAKEEAERANSAKSEFLSRMSHELRTPLNAILGFGQLLQMQELAPTQHDRVSHIVNAGRHLLGLINEVLDISRIEAGRVELSLEPVHVAGTVAEALEFIRPLAAERGVTIHPLDAAHPHHGRHVMADRQRLKQVMLNLLANAVKYNRQGGTVRLEHAEGSNGHTRIVVADTGPGIAPDKMGRLFTAFDRLGAETSAVQGTGLGLALSQRLVTAMKGDIGVQSVVGEGTRFWVELPPAENQMAAAARHREDGAAQEKPELARTCHVLYIEDNLSNLTLVEHLLVDHVGVRLTTAMQGGMGLEMARRHRPDLILLDLHLPDVPGWEVLADLKADETTRTIPVVIVSADATPRQIERLMKAGAHSYLTKPLDVKRFLRLLRQTLEPTSI